MFFHTTVNPGSGTGIPVLRSSSTVIPVRKKGAGIANPTVKAIKMAFKKEREDKSYILSYILLI
jgi:hypothetical protein